MILSVSRRTDIPAFYSEWFYNRLLEGYALVRNPMNPHQVSHITLTPDVVDCIVFWSKNPVPMLGKLSQLEKYMYYFQYTLNAYGKDMEPFVPLLSERLETFKKLATLLGPERVLWRYDPIGISAVYSVDWHIQQFGRIAHMLNGYTSQCTISFMDQYSCNKRALKDRGITTPTLDELLRLAAAFSSIARDNGLVLYTCAEEVDLSAYGIGHGKCIDPTRIEALLGCKLDIAKDPNQRPACGCCASIDLGLYHSCGHGCVYCYANHSGKVGAALGEGWQMDMNGAMLGSEVSEGDKVVVRKVKRLRLGG